MNEEKEETKNEWSFIASHFSCLFFHILKVYKQRWFCLSLKKHNNRHSLNLKQRTFCATNLSIFCSARWCKILQKLLFSERKKTACTVQLIIYIREMTQSVYHFYYVLLCSINNFGWISHIAIRIAIGIHSYIRMKPFEFITTSRFSLMYIHFVYTFFLYVFKLKLVFGIDFFSSSCLHWWEARNG